MSAATLLAAEALLIAQGAAGVATGIASWMIILIVVAGVIGVAIIIARAAGVSVPPYIIQIGWVVIAVCIGIVAIRFIMSLL
jgi:hypothetical protein